MAKIPDLQLTVPRLKADPEATRQLAAYTAKLQNILLDIYSQLGTVPIVSSAPDVKELEEKGMPNGEVRSDIKILDDATQTNRRIYYKVNGTLRYIESD